MIGEELRHLDSLKLRDIYKDVVRHADKTLSSICHYQDLAYSCRKHVVSDLLNKIVYMKFVGFIVRSRKMIWQILNQAYLTDNILPIQLSLISIDGNLSICNAVTLYE